MALAIVYFFLKAAPALGVEIPVCIEGNMYCHVVIMLY